MDVPFTRFFGFMKSWPWIPLCLLLFATNTHIAPDTFLTKISALDSVIYLSIADAAPGLPATGSGLVYHGAQRLIVPWLLGVLAKLLGVSNWDMFTFFGHLVVLAVAGIFWKCSAFVTQSHSARLLGLGALCFHVYLFRLSLAFSGFVNDAVFVLGLAVSLLGLLEVSLVWLAVGIACMAVGKQTVFFAIPTLVAWTFLTTAWSFKFSRRKLIGFWAAMISICLAQLVLIHHLIVPFSTPPTTSAMIKGFYEWAKGARGWEGVTQLAVFGARGVLGLLAPLSISAILYFCRSNGRKSLALSHEQRLFLLLLFSILFQPVLSGPNLTDASIQRLGSLGMIPLLLFALSTRNAQQLEIKPRAVVAVLFLFFISSFHHLFSILGPKLEYRFLFLGIHLVSIAGILFILYNQLPTKLGLGAHDLGQGPVDKASRLQSRTNSI